MSPATYRHAYAQTEGPCAYCSTDTVRMTQQIDEDGGPICGWHRCCATCSADDN